MADEKETTGKVIIKLRDKSSIFHDPGQSATLSGAMVIEVKESARISRALKGGAIEKATKAELDEYQKSSKEPKAAPAPKAETPVEKKETEDVAGKETPVPGKDKK